MNLLVNTHAKNFIIDTFPDHRTTCLNLIICWTIMAWSTILLMALPDSQRQVNCHPGKQICLEGRPIPSVASDGLTNIYNEVSLNVIQKQCKLE